jgi:hypothetical protein
LHDFHSAMAYGLAFQNSVLNICFFAAKHAALCSISALISFRMPREMMLGMMVEAKLIWVLELSIVRGVTRVARAPPWGGALEL